MRDPVDRAVRAIARRNSFALVWAQFGLTHLVMLGAIGLLALYVKMHGHFWELVAVSQAIVSADNLISVKLTRRMWRPVWAWERGARNEGATIAAWLALATLPIEYVRRMRKYPFLFGYLPFIAFAVWRLGLPWWAFPIIAVVGSVAIVGSLIVRYFTMEIVTRPVLEEVANDLPADFEIAAPGLPLRARLLLAAPAVNVITGVVVAGLAHGRHASLSDLGVSWLIAVVVSFTISLELTVLALRSIASSLTDLRRATERVRGGDYSARVPVVSTDETGSLAQSFNTMVEGLDERERLREAFGAYVDPGLAERVLSEGVDLEGEEVEASILFLDVRNFTAFAERASPHDVVALLTELWELVVPVLLRHGGHANKFIGDGLLGVFGVPDRLADHAERAVSAALQIAAVVRETYGARVGVGIGVNTGRVIAGTVGGGGRVEFTVIGDTVNTAARVEAATRETGDDVLITDATRAQLKPGRFEFDEREPVPLKGKRQTVGLWVPRIVASTGAQATAAASGRVPAPAGAGANPGGTKRTPERH
jgi:class 3 adenylate cyclase